MANPFKRTAIETHIALPTYLAVHYFLNFLRLHICFYHPPLLEPLSTSSIALDKLHQHMLHPNGSLSYLSGTLSVISLLEVKGHQQ
jgi:hypothetical protein